MRREPASSIDLPYDTSSARAARHWAATVLDGVIGDDVVYDITVCVSELVTNSIEHTTPTDHRKDVTCKIYIRHLTTTTLVHLECVDPGSEERAPIDRWAADNDEHGRGLRIVDGFADEWGYDDTVPDQRTTWFIIVVQRPDPQSN
jgi:anti-sigma regulatory factor (Ser/Thr protein kinase)